MNESINTQEPVEESVETSTLPVSPEGDSPRGWNMGAFTFNWIWGLFHGVWVLSFVTCAFWMILLVGYVFYLFIAPNSNDSSSFSEVFMLSWFVVFVLSVIFGIFGNRWAHARGIEGGTSNVAHSEHIWSVWGGIIFAIELIVYTNWALSNGNTMVIIYGFTLASLSVPLLIILLIAKVAHKVIPHNKSS